MPQACLSITHNPSMILTSNDSPKQRENKLLCLYYCRSYRIHTNKTKRQGNTKDYSVWHDIIYFRSCTALCLRLYDVCAMSEHKLWPIIFDKWSEGILCPVSCCAVPSLNATHKIIFIMFSLGLWSIQYSEIQ